MLPDSLGSDHFPIIWEMDLSIGRLPKLKDRLRWDWNRADWSAFRHFVDSKISDFHARHPNECSLDVKVSYFREALLGAAKAHIGLVRINRPDRKWLTPEVKEAIRTRNLLGRDLANRRTEWITACRRVTELTTASKQKLA